MSSTQEQKNTETSSDLPEQRQDAVPARQWLPSLPSLPGWCAKFNITYGRIAILVAMLALLVGLVLMPVGMSHQNNSRLPVIGSMESLAVDYAGQTSLRAGMAFGACKLTGALINVVRSVEISTVVASVNPGSLLEIIASTIERFSEIFLLVMGIGMTAKMLVSIGTWLCFKICLPLSLIFGLLRIFGLFHSDEGEDRLLWARPLATFFLKCGLLAGLFLPLTAVVNNYVAANVLNNRWNELAAEMPQENDHILDFSLGRLMGEQPAASPSTGDGADPEKAEATEAASRAVEAEGETGSSSSVPVPLEDSTEPSLLQRMKDGLKRFGQSDTPDEATEQPATAEQTSPASSPAAGPSTGDEATPEKAEAAETPNRQAEGWMDSGFSVAGSLKSISETTSMLQGIGDSLKKLGQLPADLLNKAKDKIREITDYADRLVDRLMEMIVLFGLTTLVIPLTSFVMLKGTLRILIKESRAVTPREIRLTMRQMSKNLAKRFEQKQDPIAQGKEGLDGGRKGISQGTSNLPEEKQAAIPPKTPTAEKE